MDSFLFLVGVSYVSIFVVCYHITFWAFGAAHSLSWDYRPEVPQKEEAERRVPWSQKPIGNWVHRVILRREVEDVWKTKKEDEQVPDAEKALEPPARITVSEGVDSPGMVTEITEVSRQISRTSRVSEKAPAEAAAPVIVHASALHMALVRRVLKPLKAAANSITITLVFSLIVAVVKDLKALFVDISDQGGPSWHGPDGRPPLSFVIDTGAWFSLSIPFSCLIFSILASFIGGITVPLALILLGASFARLRIPRPLSRLPFAAMFSAAIVKMAIIPVAGIFIIQAMTKGGLMDRQSRAERFVAMFLSGTPASVK
jgi:auxin efflux carrier family protein